MIQISRWDNARGVVEQPLPSALDRAWLIDADDLLWIDMIDPTEEEEKGVLREFFDFHHLAIEDCKSLTHHPKIDDFNRYLFIIVHSVKPIVGETDFDTDKLAAFIGENFLVTYHREAMPGIDVAAKYCLANPRTLAKGPDNIFHLIIDTMVDAYLPVLDRMDDQIDRIEDEIFRNPRNTTLSDILAMKKNVMRLRRVATHQKEILNRLSRGEFDLITDDERIYYRDVYDHLVRIADLAETYRDLVTGSLDAYLSVVSNRMNEVMKTLTIIATLILPMSLVAGIYGMNFHFIPELGWRFGYPFALGIMCLIAVGMLTYFRRKRWF